VNDAVVVMVNESVDVSASMKEKGEVVYLAARKAALRAIRSVDVMAASKDVKSAAEMVVEMVGGMVLKLAHFWAAKLASPMVDLMVGELGDDSAALLVAPMVVGMVDDLVCDMVEKRVHEMAVLWAVLKVESLDEWMAVAKVA